ncbi:MAG TPA: hypothetical protein VK177_02705 [Flavobacteriales bacterium]|nr:hypothetical protein [Flavobacteriales bacterium]
MRYITTILFLVLFSGEVLSQVEIDKNIVLTGNDSSELQVRQVNSMLDTTNLVSAMTFQKNSIAFASSGTFTNDSILLTSPVTFTAYKNGQVFTFEIPAQTNDSVYINVNGLGWKKLLYKNTKLFSLALKQGQMIETIYNGSDFEITSILRSNCPAGFVEANEHYCIEKNESPLVNFFSAIVTCSNKNARLCTWNEWYYACQKSGLGLVNMTNNYEWIDSATNSTNQVVILGNGGCLFKALSVNTTPYFFRCCYSK